MQIRHFIMPKKQENKVVCYDEVIKLSGELEENKAKKLKNLQIIKSEGFLFAIFIYFKVLHCSSN